MLETTANICSPYVVYLFYKLIFILVHTGH